jgi:hypothetical protein
VSVAVLGCLGRSEATLVELVVSPKECGPVGSDVRRRVR